MKLYLTGLGWVDDAPTGHRLRWSYPLQAPDGSGGFLGLPDTIIVERAWMDELSPRKPETPGESTALLSVPASWWKVHGDIIPDGWIVCRFELPAPVQAVRFTYRGMTTRLRVFDSATDTLVAERSVSDGEVVLVEAADMDRFELLGMGSRFENFRSLDLFDDRGLSFEEIARIRVKKTLDADLAAVTPRSSIPTTLDAAEWQEFVTAAQEGQASGPADLKEGEASPWEIFGMMAALRWEHALLFGHGFFDGPRTKWPKIDELKRDLLLEKIPSGKTAVYRVREKDKRVGPSNLVICLSRPVADLTAPGVPLYGDPKVHFGIDAKTDKPVFEASYNLHWQQTAADALGVRLEEETSSSPSIGGDLLKESIENRTRFPDEMPGEGNLTRRREVPFHDVRVRCRACATDAWDRESTFSAWSPWTGLSFGYEPPAPPLIEARYQSGTATLTRQTETPALPGWLPDKVIKEDAGAKVHVYRQKSGAAGQPRLETVTVSAPVYVGASRYRTTIAGAGTLSDFLGGFLVAPPFKAEVTGVSGSDVYFEPGDGGTTLFPAGTAELHQMPTHLDLWTKVAEFDPATLPTELNVPDPLPGPDGVSDTVAYHLRLKALGKVGPAGNTVRAVRIPVTPTVPPPFIAEPLGVDFYNRTMIKLTFTNPLSAGLYTVWWADGTPGDFAAEAVPGEQRAQSPYQNYHLFDSLSLPLPQSAGRTVTIGVQQVNDGGGQSGFVTATLLL
ncbi:hypothetical protein WCX72_03160 [Sulfurimonas sp. HSL1-6]|uniref:hypothetical protein n=1 Tax=Thiomicrolovo immobilis TaxID=3131935 RepID=UPI0031F8E968